MNKKNDKKYIKEMYSKTTKILYEYVLEVLKSYEYEGSPIYNDYIDRETLNQMVDRVLEKAGELAYIEEVILKEEINDLVDVKLLLRAVIELIIINELFVVSNEEAIINEGIEENREESMIYYINLFDNNIEQPLINELIEVKQYFGDFL